MRCDKHKGHMTLPAMSTCKNCGGPSSSISVALCGSCSNKLKQCDLCRAPVKDDSSSGK